MQLLAGLTPKQLCLLLSSAACLQRWLELLNLQVTQAQQVSNKPLHSVLHMQPLRCHGTLGASCHPLFAMESVSNICDSLLSLATHGHVLLRSCRAVCRWFHAGGASQCRGHSGSGAASGNQRLSMQMLDCFLRAGTPAGPPGHGEDRGGWVPAEATVAVPEAAGHMACRWGVSGYRYQQNAQGCCSSVAARLSRDTAAGVAASVTSSVTPSICGPHSQVHPLLHVPGEWACKTMRRQEPEHWTCRLREIKQPFLTMKGCTTMKGCRRHMWPGWHGPVPCRGPCCSLQASPLRCCRRAASGHLPAVQQAHPAAGHCPAAGLAAARCWSPMPVLQARCQALEPHAGGAACSPKYHLHPAASCSPAADTGAPGGSAAGAAADGGDSGAAVAAQAQCRCTAGHVGCMEALPEAGPQVRMAATYADVSPGSM